MNIPVLAVALLYMSIQTARAAVLYSRLRKRTAHRWYHTLIK